MLWKIIYRIVRKLKTDYHPVEPEIKKDGEFEFYVKQDFETFK
jgi:hypothetical protein